MIVLLNCSINLLANNEYNQHNTSTGDVIFSKDSVLVSYNDLRLANSKLIELNYEKQINNNLRNVISNDSIIIMDYKRINKQLNKDCKKAIRQRNVAISGVVLFFITTILFILK